eukprot:9909071-Prorocentrum_lima.AAC.1
MTSSLVGSEMCIRDRGRRGLGGVAERYRQPERYPQRKKSHVLFGSNRAMLRAPKASHGAVRTEQH